MLKYVYFDLDDTIYDRSVPFVRAFNEFFADQYSADTAKQGYLTCNRRGQEVFADSQTGKISMRDMYIYRYTMGLKDLGILIDDETALAIQTLYKKYQGMLELTPVMEKVLNRCAERFDLVGLITNGPGKHQREKAACLGLNRWITDEKIFVSGELGMIKPDVRVFQTAERALGTIPEETLYIGDSHETDIIGAAGAGWHTLWLNKKHESIPAGAVRPDIEVYSEEELLETITLI